MKTAQYTIPYPEGFHARPASEFVSKAQQFSSTITLIKEGKEANGKSVIQVMTLGAKYGDTVQVRVEGTDEEEAMAAISELLGGSLNTRN